ncbi:multiple epidermal growth factor-like domains protein 10 [Saccostrea echinata]|uniref:multiple epidermal growth factor-like domains protein 10 n=1 Tax=Saccostrea echinata TaxID=191078 RepID=UPI002A825D1C|nr:multiple epidermal growth factor-like domains protein 10 [Saccostrea echinata]
MNHLNNFLLWIFCFLSRFTHSLGYDDLSAGKNASQGPTYLAWRPQFYAAVNAVDRNNSSCMRTREIGSASPYRETWWMVDLGDIYSVFKIRILFKGYGEELVQRQRGRFAGFALYLSNSTNKDEGYMCYKDGPELPPLDFTTTCIGYGQYITFYNERLENYTYPEGYAYLSYTELCEVIVQGCKLAGVYGERCHKKCPGGCYGSKCNIITGVCPGCKPGWIGNYCQTRCDSGHYGEYCISKCSSKCISECSHVDGTCICSHGLRGSPHCTTECPSGFYGPNCGHICSQHSKLNDTCHRINGTCPRGCKDSFSGLRCDIPNQIYEKSNESSSTALMAALVMSGIFNVFCLVFIAALKRKQIAKILKGKSAGSQKYISRTEIHTNQLQADDIHNYQEIGESENKTHYSNLQLKTL